MPTSGPSRSHRWFALGERTRLAPRGLPLMAAMVAVLTSTGLVVGLPWLLPYLVIVPVFPLLLLDIRADDASRATFRVLTWAAAICVTTLAWSLSAPDWVERAVPDAGFAAWETGRFLDTGKGVLARPADYATDHALDYVYVSVGSAFGGGLVPLAMGAKQIVIATHVWGCRIAAGDAHAWLYGLPPWSTAGALGYLLLLLGWAEVTGAYLRRGRIRWRVLGQRVALATSVLAIHLSLKLALAPLWRDWLAAPPGH